MPDQDWTGYEEYKKTGWHRKIHIHQVPFYYIEYGLAQLGAAQIWANSIKEPTKSSRRLSPCSLPGSYRYPSKTF